MKSKFLKGLIVIVIASSVTACNMNRTQRHTAVGAAVSKLAGNWVGGDMGSTLGGAALGGLIGSQWNMRDDDDDRYERRGRHHHHHYHRHYHDDDDD